MIHERLPDFIGIGTPKAGTTWLCRLLNQHPNISISTKKEIHYFSSEDNYGKGIEWYLSNLNVSDKNKLIGEFSTKYLKNFQKVIPRIKSTYEGKKLPKMICILRNPLERSLSHYNWRLQIGALPSNTSLTDALKIDKGIEIFSHYKKPLQSFIDEFGKENIIIFRSKDLFSKQNVVLNNLERFLNLVAYSNYDDYIPKSYTINPRNRSIEKLRIKLKQYLENNKFNFLVNTKLYYLFSNSYRNLNNKSKKNVINSEEINDLKKKLQEEINFYNTFNHFTS